MDTFDSLALVRDKLADPDDWLKYADAPIPVAERIGKYDLYRACLTTDNKAQFAALSIAIHRLFPGRVFTHPSVLPNLVLDVIDFNNHLATTHADVLRVIDKALELRGHSVTELEDMADGIRATRLELQKVKQLMERRGRRFPADFEDRPLNDQLHLVEVTP